MPEGLAQMLNDRHLLAYIWFAGQVNASVIICGDDPGISKMFLNSIIPILPSVDQTTIIEKDHRKLETSTMAFNNHILYGKSFGITFSDALQNALTTHPDLIIIDELAQSHVKDVLNATNLVESFVTTMDCNLDGRQLLSRIVQRPAKKEDCMARAIDVTIRIDSKSGTVSVMEYLWLSKLEIESAEPIHSSDMLCTNLQEVHTKEALSQSKIVKKYLSFTGLSLGESISRSQKAAKSIAR